MDKIIHEFPFVPRHDISPESILSVSIELDKNEHQLLGFMALNRPNFYNKPGKVYGRLLSPCPFWFSE
jgi:hypothetical protein